MSSDGKTVVNYSYNSWGKLIWHHRAVWQRALGKDNPYRYKGYYYDEETGMYYLKSRYYNPEICRFISADDVELTTSFANWHCQIRICMRIVIIIR